jgi:hypothetical protein
MKPDMKPSKRILDPAFHYRPSHATDIRQTFERIRQELEQTRSEKVVVVKLTKTG